MTGNNSLTYRNIFVPDNTISETKLNSFFQNREVKIGEEIEFSKSKKEELQDYFSEEYENEIVTSILSGDNMKFYALPIKILYSRKLEEEGLPKELKFNGYKVNLKIKELDIDKTIEIDKKERMVIYKIEPLVDRDRLMKIQSKIDNHEKSYNDAIGPCVKEYYKKFN